MGRTPTLRTLRDAIAYFSDPDRCLAFAVALRWPEGVTCPACGGKDVTFLSTRRVWKCRREHSKQQFSVKVGTIFEDSPIGLDKWFATIWMVANRPEEITSHEIARALAVSRKTAWYMLHRIRLAMQTGSFEKAVSEDASDPAAIVLRLPKAGTWVG